MVVNRCRDRLLDYMRADSGTRVHIQVHVYVPRYTSTYASSSIVRCSPLYPVRRGLFPQHLSFGLPFQLHGIPRRRRPAFRLESTKRRNRGGTDLPKRRERNCRALNLALSSAKNRSEAEWANSDLNRRKTVSLVSLASMRLPGLKSELRHRDRAREFARRRSSGPTRI